MEFKYTGTYNIPVDLQTTLESGQTFLWNKENGTMFEESNTVNPIYSTARTINNNEIMVLRIACEDNELIWECTHKQGGQYIESIFQLDKNIKQIQNYIIEKDTNGVIGNAINLFPELRIIREPLFSTLISFICSTQMRVERIHKMVQNISKEFGKSTEINGYKYYSFPTPQELSIATEKDLKNLKLGYRASYVVKTVNMINNNSLPLELSKDITEARKHLEEYVGVGPKVADCVLLYGAGFASVVPVDTWIERAVNIYYPEHEHSNKRKTARSFESLFGDYAGFAQAYLFHYMRTENQL